MSVLIVSPKGKGNTYNLSCYIAKNIGAELLVLEKKEERDWKDYDSIILSSGGDCSFCADLLFHREQEKSLHIFICIGIIRACRRNNLSSLLLQA